MKHKNDELFWSLFCVCLLENQRKLFELLRRVVAGLHIQDYSSLIL